MTNKQYELERNSCIDDAVELTNKACGESATSKNEAKIFNRKWNVTFAANMDKLYNERFVK